MAKKSSKKQVAETDQPREGVIPPARLLALNLHELHFERKGAWPDPERDDLEHQARFGLTAVRLGPGRMGVEFEVTMEPSDVYFLSVSYRMDFEVDAASTEEEKTFFQRVAARIAPIVAYPYVRETVSSITGKAGAPRIVALPVLNVGGIFDPDTIEIRDGALD